MLAFALLFACSGSIDPFTVVTVNTGTTEGMAHDDAPDDGYTGAHATTSDTWYGDGLAWLPAVEAATAFFAATDADVVGFQEIFYSGLCPDIPADQHADFVCETWAAGDPTVAQVILGDRWQVACHPGKDDKCLAVRRSFGSFAGCDDDFCLEGLAGAEVDGCGSGARVARGVVELERGGTLTVVNYHGSSGLTSEEQDCRALQVDQVFVDMDGEPGANGDINLVLGDFNTDPGRWVEIDPSAARWADFVGEGLDFGFLSDVGPDAEPTYSLVANIDHVAGEGLVGSCTPGHISDATYFDHVPIVCEVSEP